MGKDMRGYRNRPRDGAVKARATGKLRDMFPEAWIECLAEARAEIPMSPDYDLRNSKVQDLRRLKMRHRFPEEYAMLREQEKILYDKERDDAREEDR